MKVILFGATGMVGQGVLRECLLDSGVEQVLSVSRSSTGQHSPKLKEILRKDLFDLSGLESSLSGFDACFFCLGVSSVGLSPEDYHRLTYDLTLSVANTLVPLNRGMTFIYVSGTGTDSSEKGRSRWARVKGATENALLRMPFKAAYMFRPGYIHPMHGVVAKTKWVNSFYAVLGPLFPVIRRLAPKYVTTTENMGRAMLHAARHGAPKQVLESNDINALA
jgi:uncharacterized protein YbjT (DUF2867 family)